MRTMDDEGQVLDAEYSVEAEPAGQLLSLVMESSSGSRTSTGRAPRNVDYRRALEVLLRRLKARRAVLLDGVVDSRITSSLPEEKRRLFAQPIILKDADDIAALRRRLCTAQSLIGQVPEATKAGNGTKRIRLRLSVPGYSTADAALLAGELARPASAELPEQDAFTPPRKPLDEWWADDPTERYWMEITTRPDLGSNLIAPRLDGSGAEYWSYSLVTAVRPGDIVFHWHKGLNTAPGIVGHSIAAAGPFDDRLVWEARGTYGRQRPIDGRPRPAWRFELTGYTALASPIGQEILRPLEDQIRRFKDELGTQVSGPLYFPFVFSGSRPIRTSQAYLVKVPAGLLQLVPGMTEPIHGLAAFRARQAGTSQTKPRHRSGTGYIADPVLRKAIEEHAVRCSLDYYPDYDINDVGTTESYDLLAVKGDEEIHIEVKGSTGTADTVELTSNEVAHARTTRTDLVVIDQISWERLPDGAIRTYGGRRRRWTTWQPDEHDLRPTSYRYRLPEQHQQD
ncbi:protein NO VEIN domain-containing protein [Sphaerisporangium aureirubrum]|uniref:Protein NO VEIN domain-containing protein n=1 Tax=Sphaerisporangium aureirubrum TaxID=1544736 RepID=A0ABW1NQB9_9ACTN